MGRRRCCCECWIWQDDFNRSNSTDVGTGWVEDTGDWEILDNELHEKYGGGGTANAKLFGVNRIPERSDGEMHIGVDVIDPNEDDLFYIYPCCQDTETTGAAYVEYKYDGSNYWTVTIQKGVASTSGSILASPSTPGIFRLECCADHYVGMIRAGVVSVADPMVWADDADPGTGRYYALGHDNETNGATFDNFSVMEIRLSETVQCSDCWCWCLGYTPGKSLVATFHSCTERASCLEGYSVNLEWDWNSGTPVWTGNDTWTDGTLTQYFEINLSCDDTEPDADWPGKNFTMWFGNTGCHVGDSGPWQPDAETSDCEPFSLSFGPFYMSYTDLNCRACYDVLDDTEENGEYYITITEA